MNWEKFLPANVHPGDGDDLKKKEANPSQVLPAEKQTNKQEALKIIHFKWSLKKHGDGDEWSPAKRHGATENKEVKNKIKQKK